MQLVSDGTIAAARAVVEQSEPLRVESIRPKTKREALTQLERLTSLDELLPGVLGPSAQRWAQDLLDFIFEGHCAA